MVTFYGISREPNTTEYFSPWDRTAALFFPTQQDPQTTYVRITSSTYGDICTVAIPKGDAIYLDEIIAPYMHQPSLPLEGTTSGAPGQTEMLNTFSIRKGSSPQSLSLYFTMLAYEDYNYGIQYSTSSAGQVVSFPISNIADNRQLVLSSKRTFTSNTSFYVGTNTYRIDTMNAVSVYKHSYLPSGQDSININGIVYQFKDTCRTHALYYRNSAGGYDTYLLAGVVETREYTKDVMDERRTGYDNFRNNYRRKFVCRSDYLTDAQMDLAYRHLLGSNDVRIHDLERDEIIKCVITDTNTELAKWKNGKKINYFKITLEESEKHITR